MFPTLSILTRIKRFLNHAPPTSFVRISLDTEGSLYVSPMPFGPYDVRNQMLKRYLNAKITRVLVLVTDEEIKKKAKKNILKIYEKYNIEYVRLPFKDLFAPVVDQINLAIPQLMVHLKKKQNVAIHCNAGVGRTGVVAACLVAAANKVSGPEAIEHIKSQMMINLTDEQMRFINAWAESNLKELQYL